MKLKFSADTHTYESIEDPNKKWTSVTSVISLFKEPFDQEGIAKKSSKNKRSKWYGKTPEEIIEIWKSETNRATTLGSLYHDKREAELIECNTIRRNGIDLPIFRPLVDGLLKLSPDQKLVPGIYPEHLAYLNSAKICGQADRVEVVGDVVNIYDYKTNKEIKNKSYKNWEGQYKMMLPPLNNIQDCNLMHYALQLSIYMYMILKHNHNLKPGKLEIHHIIFEKDGVNEYGYPIVSIDTYGDPIVKEVVPYELPYMKKEVNAIIKYLKTNKK